MADVQITCVSKPHPESPHEHITELGNAAAGWKWPSKRVIASIEAGTNTFFALDPLTWKRANVEVVREEGKAPYLRARADGVWNNILLLLDQCPRS
jgi:hypothetical protein